MENIITSTFYGTSGARRTGGDADIFIDVFLTRPGLASFAFRKPRPNEEAIDETLGKGGVVKLEAPFVARTHHDHVMDAPRAVKKVGGTLYRSESTLYSAGEMGCQSTACSASPKVTRSPSASPR